MNDKLDKYLKKAVKCKRKNTKLNNRIYLTLYRNFIIVPILLVYIISFLSKFYD